MRKIFVTMLFAVSWAGMVDAQEMTGAKAEEVKKEIVQLEQEKAQDLLSDNPADWFERPDADDLDYTNPDGTMMTKAQHIAQFRSGERKIHTVKRPDFQVHIYNSGTTAVVTYFGSEDLELKGKTSTVFLQTTDVFVKQENTWRTVVHHVNFAPPK
jgi:uncharacterized protein DUF4440